MSEEHSAPAQPDGLQDIDRSQVAYTVFSGFCMGTADVVPGVSGGTMAVALGIYHQLLGAISSVGRRETLRRLLRFDIRGLLQAVHWRFLLSLVGGLALGVIIMVKVVKLPTMVLAASPSRPAVYAVFFGMVATSTITLSRHVKAWNGLRGFMVVVGTAIGYFVVSRVPVDTPDGAWFIFVCGMIGICAMLLPGISGSFILLILGKYAYILGALGKLQLSVILPFLAGCVTGILSFSRLLDWLLTRFRDTVLATLIGLLIGSLYRIWPYQHIVEKMVRHKLQPVSATPFWPESFDLKLVALCVLGAAFVAGIEYYAVIRQRREDERDAERSGAEASAS